MSWTNAATPGHEGALVGLLECHDTRQRSDGFRELTLHDEDAAAKGIYLRWVQVGCTCGWRSRRMDAPIGACWWRAASSVPTLSPAHVDAPTWFEDQCLTIWRAHATATPCPDDETLAVWCDGRLAAGEDVVLIQHLLSCDDCRTVVSEVCQAREELAATPANALVSDEDKS